MVDFAFFLHMMETKWALWLPDNLLVGRTGGGSQSKDKEGPDGHLGSDWSSSESAWELRPGVTGPLLGTKALALLPQAFGKQQEEGPVRQL